MMNQEKKRRLALLLMLLAGLFCLGHQYLIHKNAVGNFGQDFRAVYASSRCVISGCKPYDYADIREQFLKQGGSLAEAGTLTSGPFQPYYVGYPPTALFYLTPLAFLRWPVALVAYLSISIALYAIALLLFTDLCLACGSFAATACLALFVAVEGVIVGLAQPTLFIAALLCIGMWCLIKDRHPLAGVFCFSLSLIFKPQLGGLVLLYFLVSTALHRKRAWQVIGLAVLLSLPALFWFSMHPATHNWVRDYRTNLEGITAPGNLSDPGPQHKNENQIVNLQTVVSFYRDEPSFYNHVVWAFSAVVIAIWLYPAVRRRAGFEKDILCLSAIALFSMLPVYHRFYDDRALLIIFPALAILMKRTLWWGRIAAVLTVATTFVLSDGYLGRSSSDTPLVRHFMHHPIVQILLMRTAPLALLTMAIFYLAVIYVYPIANKLKASSTDIVA